MTTKLSNFRSCVWLIQAVLLATTLIVSSINTPLNPTGENFSQVLSVTTDNDEAIVIMDGPEGPVILYPAREVGTFKVNVLVRLAEGMKDVDKAKVSGALKSSSGLTIEAGSLKKEGNLLSAVLVVSPGESQGRFAVTYDGGDNASQVHRNVRIQSVSVDLDGDSDDNNGFGLPDRSAAEDAIEGDQAADGKLVTPSQGDADGDGLPDYADGFRLAGFSNANSAGAGFQLVPLVVELKGGFDPEFAKVTFEYASMSEPWIGGGLRNGGAGDPHPVMVSKRGIRLWNQPANQRTSGASLALVLGSGDFIPAGAEIDWLKLNVGANQREATIYVEYVGEPANADPEKYGIKVKVRQNKVKLGGSSGSGGI